jgi:hypothetical protein
MFFSDFFLIGVGGTGGHLAAPLARLIAYHPNTQGAPLTFIDGDAFDESNLKRQIVGASQLNLNKARAMKDFCSYQGLTDNIEHREDFISYSTFIPMIRNAERPVIICSVDNDATRKSIIDAITNCREGRDFFYITPGNSDGIEDVRGQTLWWGRIDDTNVGMNPVLAYPNLENPQDSIPHSGSCALHAPSRPQLISANFLVAGMTLMVLQNLLDGTLDTSQSGMFFNLRNMKTTVS